ncbi:hypothetical protein F5Y16DRAFT_415600 [Xylariaceae sp. FL0255]|nr:hypothetical protein F5Y16DRAFT_415600 [Xylariaceae sp. FL0255]
MTSDDALENFEDPDFDPTEFFKSIDEDVAKIIELKDVLQRRAKRRPRPFYIEKTPLNSHANGVKCNLPGCAIKVQYNGYRIACVPSLKAGRYGVDFYHVKCFETLADFSKSELLNYLEPLSIMNASSRGLSQSTIDRGQYLLDRGA